MAILTSLTHAVESTDNSLIPQHTTTVSPAKEYLCQQLCQMFPEYKDIIVETHKYPNALQVLLEMVPIKTFSEEYAKERVDGIIDTDIPKFQANMKLAREIIVMCVEDSNATNLQKLLEDKEEAITNMNEGEITMIVYNIVKNININTVYGAKNFNRIIQSGLFLREQWRLTGEIRVVTFWGDTPWCVLLTPQNIETMNNGEHKRFLQMRQWPKDFLVLIISQLRIAIRTPSMTLRNTLTEFLKENTSTQ